MTTIRIVATPSCRYLAAVLVLGAGCGATGATKDTPAALDAAADQAATPGMDLGMSVAPTEGGADVAEMTPRQGRAFETSFESVDDFKGFYIVSQDYMGTSSHDRSSEKVRTGGYSHKGWIYAANPPSTSTQNNNHRGYPTIQLYKTPGGAYKTPVLIEFWVWLDMVFRPGEWFSFATLDHTTADQWDAVLVNLSDKGIVHLHHVPYSQQAKTTFQTTTIKFPLKQWVKLTVSLHFGATDGYAKVWQDDQLVSTAEVKRGNGLFTQAHFGLYAAPSISSGVVYNDDLVIKEAVEGNP
jgi:hypothetical protein